MLARTTTSPQLRDKWRDGLAGNRAAPADVLIRLLHGAPDERVPFGLHYRQLPDDVVDAWIAHPRPRVRRLLAERTSLTPAQRERLFREADARLRWILLVGLVDAGLELTDATYDLLAADASDQIRSELALHRDLPTRHLIAFAADQDASVRRRVTPRAWPHLDDATRAALLADPDAPVRATARLRHHEAVPLAAADFDALPDSSDRGRAAERCALTRELAEALAHGPDVGLRRAVARNAGLDADLVAVLGQDPDDSVRWRVSLRPELPEEQRAGIRFDKDPAVRIPVLDWVREQQDDPAAMRRLAASRHFLVRRSVACAKNLPQDVADLLARDEDHAVRLLLAESCAQAPAELLSEMWRTWDGYSAARMPEHPNFPREHTLRHADHPHPRMRELALDDPDSTEELVERLSRDPAYGVRWRALRDPRLSVASVIRLLDDPHDGIRSTAAGDSRLPAHVLAGLLDDPATADSAAGNRALPAEVMRHLLELRPPAPAAVSA
ncbi:PE-PGRS family protein [Streptomyces sp. CB01881]|nr:PE-PGRS family protein [Streptomyces sp. CB01881]TYC70815.1 PE-PGRS family protein [Streptomyces sp. CB01881]